MLHARKDDPVLQALCTAKPRCALEDGGDTAVVKVSTPIGCLPFERETQPALAGVVTTPGRHGCPRKSMNSRVSQSGCESELPRCPGGISHKLLDPALFTFLENGDSTSQIE